MKYRKLAYSNARDLVFGKSLHPIRTRHGLVIGGGTVYPELNFTLPDLEINAAAMPEVARHYRQIIKESLNRAAELETPGVVIEFETLPPMTEFPNGGFALCVMGVSAF